MHGVFPLIYHSLKFHATIIPPQIMQKIKSYNIDIIKTNMFMTSELIKLMNLFIENDIDVLPFKGPVLSQMLYGDVTLRQYVDLDILIDKKDREKCYELLTKHNYITELKKEYLKNDLYLEKNSDIQFYNKTNNTLIELHWKLFRNQFSQNIPYTDLFINNSIVSLQNKNFKTFSCEILLVYLCMHGSKHCWERISWILDIDKLIRHNQNLDWEYIKKQSRQLECEVMLNLGLVLANKFFSTPISFKYSINHKLIDFIENTFNSLHIEQTELENNLYQTKFHYLIQDTYLLKYKFILNTIFRIKDRDVLEIHLSRKLYFLYFPIRIFRILKKYFYHLLIK